MRGYMTVLLLVVFVLSGYTIQTNSNIGINNAEGNKSIDLSNFTEEKLNLVTKDADKVNEKGIHITFYTNNDGIIFGFTSSGHSGYAEKGSDIVCAAISALAYHAPNSIRRYTKDNVTWEEKDGYGKCFLHGKVSQQSILFMESTSASMKDIEEQYGEYVKVNYVTVK